MPSPAAPLIDMPELLDRCADDAAFVGDLLAMFVRGAPALFDEMSSTIASGRTAAAAASAHALKGNALNVAARPLGERLADAERALTTGRSVDVNALADLLARTIAAIDGCQAGLDASLTPVASLPT